MLDHRYERQLIEDYVRMFPGQKFDPISVVHGVQERWGIQIDWHEASIELSHLHRDGEVILVGHTRGGMTEYVVEPQKE